MPETHPLEITHLPIGDLRPDPANPRRISDEELESLTRSIREFGLIDPIIARREDKVVIGGHQRLIAARKLGLKQVPVVLVDISEEQAHVLNLALNRISGTWDQELLARLLAELKEVLDIDITLTGFSEDELQKHLKSLESREKRERLETFDLEEAARTTPVARTGDLWLLGDHRLLCGDSIDSGDVGRLMNGEKASLMATDPPYLVDYTGGNHPASKGNQGKPSKDKHWDEYVDPEASVEFYRKFLTLSLEHLNPNPRDLSRNLGVAQPTHRPGAGVCGECRFAPGCTCLRESSTITLWSMRDRRPNGACALDGTVECTKGCVVRRHHPGDLRASGGAPLLCGPLGPDPAP